MFEQFADFLATRYITHAVERFTKIAARLRKAGERLGKRANGIRVQIDQLHAQAHTVEAKSLVAFTFADRLDKFAKGDDDESSN